ncbi:MAG TPA: type 3 dihydrofolate reductase [Acidiferrobacteraceae bacterium]|nr:type 3 dihydrofolate reductase [Acidiferrobacteraceae bacterium]
MTEKPIISVIAAMTRDRVIGIENRLPWKLPSDMRWFRQQTMGKPIIMGRKTFESFGARPLPGRMNIIVSHNKAYQADGCTVVHCVDEALKAAGAVEEIMIIGGASLYDQLLPQTGRLYLTYVDTDIKGDAWFPALNNHRWREVERIENLKDENNPYDHKFVVLERV